MYSHIKVWWKCRAGHSWYAMISNRTLHNRSCPYCAHQLPIPGETDLASRFPNLAKEWHPAKNKQHPSEIMPGTHKKAWWICSNGHEWEAEIKSRTTGVGCPYCARKKVLKGVNDLATVNPELAKEWHPTLNGDLTPEDVTSKSGKKFWWICKNKHAYKSTIYSRNEGQGCPKCLRTLKTSFPEQAVYYYIKQEFPDAINSYKEVFNSSMELDIFIPSLNVGIEYDGKIYHSSVDSKSRDKRKYAICKKRGIVLFRIREISGNTFSFAPCDHIVEILNASDKYLNLAITHLMYCLGKTVFPDVKKDRKQIQQQYLHKKKQSLADKYPEIASEWDYEQNHPLIPENFTPHSNEKVAWICKQCGHKWKSTIGDRTRPDGTGCPDCAKTRALKKNTENRIKKKGSLAEHHPKLLAEWDYDKNQNISPNEITSGAGKKVWWKCKTCGYSWQASVCHRTSGRGCPCCNHQVVVSGKNDLATLKPTLLKEWDYKKNSLNPHEVSVGCGKKAHWKCSICGHEWFAVIASRAKGTGCPNWREHVIKK